MAIESTLTIDSGLQSIGAPQGLLQCRVASDDGTRTFIDQLSKSETFSAPCLNLLREIISNAVEHGGGDVVVRVLCGIKAALISVQQELPADDDLERLEHFFATGEDYYGYKFGDLGMPRGVGLHLLRTDETVQCWYEVDRKQQTFRLLVLVAINSASSSLN